MFARLDLSTFLICCSGDLSTLTGLLGVYLQPQKMGQDGTKKKEVAKYPGGSVSKNLRRLLFKDA